MANREKYQHRSARDENADQRNYIGEAIALTKRLAANQLYELHEICCEKLQNEGGVSEKREKELKAVKLVVEGMKHLDQSVLERNRRGRSEMSKGAKSRDGQTDVNRKKV